jgi:hypothetical protein
MKLLIRDRAETKFQDSLTRVGLLQPKDSAESCEAEEMKLNRLPRRPRALEKCYNRCGLVRPL